MRTSFRIAIRLMLSVNAIRLENECANLITFHLKTKDIILSLNFKKAIKLENVDNKIFRRINFQWSLIETIVQNLYDEWIENSFTIVDLKRINDIVEDFHTQEKDFANNENRIKRRRIDVEEVSSQDIRSMIFECVRCWL